MNTFSRTTISLLVLALLLAPNVLYAQQTNTSQTNQTLQTYNPNVNVGFGSGSGGNGFQGMNFSGVGGALFSCLNVGQAIIGGISDAFNLSSLGLGGGTGDQEVPTKDKKTQKELKKQTQTENCLNGIAYAIAKSMLQQVSQKTLNWINTGMGGNPFYVRDIDSYLKSVRDQKLQNFLGTISQNEPVFGNAIRSTVFQQLTGKSDGLLNKLKDTPEAKQYEAFQNDFTNGGWGAFLDMKKDALNNYFNAVDGVQRSATTAQQNIKDELTQGEGFLSMKRCAEYSKSSGPGLSSGQGVSAEGSGTGTTTSNGQISVSPYGASVQASLNEVQNQFEQQNNKPVCVRWETVTPGSLISKQAGEATSTGYKILIKADKINEVLGSFFDQLLNNLFSSGLGALGGRASGSSFGTNTGGPGNNVVIGSNGQILSSVTGSQNVLGYDPTNGGFNGDFDISRPQQLRAIIKTQKDYVSRVLDSQAVLNQIVPRVGALDYCMPGPNPTWSQGAGDNLSTYESALQDSRSGFVVYDHTITPRTSQVSLYDRTTDGAAPVKSRVFTQTNNNPGDLTGQASDWLTAGLNSLSTKLNALFNQQALLSAFDTVATSPQDQIYSHGFVRDAFRETSNLVGYSQNVIAYNQQYDQTVDDVNLATQELESIYTEVAQIVSVAKARYIAGQAAAGTPVNTACINQAYTIDTSPIAGLTRSESDAPDSFMIQSADARDYFYNTRLNQ